MPCMAPVSRFYRASRSSNRRRANPLAPYDLQEMRRPSRRFACRCRCGSSHERCGVLMRPFVSGALAWIYSVLRRAPNKRSQLSVGLSKRAWIPPPAALAANSPVAINAKLAPPPPPGAKANIIRPIAEIISTWIKYVAYDQSPRLPVTSQVALMGIAVQGQ
jgi:hypothetical protein